MPEQLPMNFMLAADLQQEGIVLELRDGMWIVDWGSHCLAIFSRDYATSLRTAYDLYIRGKRPLSKFEKRLQERRHHVR